MISDDVVLSFVPPAKPISMNEGDSWKVRGASAEWRDAAFWHYVEWCTQHGHLGPSQRRYVNGARVHVVLPFATERRRDAINYAKTVKHIVDGIMLAGAWLDDTAEYVEQNIPTLARQDLCVVRISPA